MHAARRRQAPADPDDPHAAEAVALRILGGAAQSSAALQRRLQYRGFSEAAAAAAVERCRELGYVDDDALAGSVAARHRRANHGRARVVADLRARGVGAEAIASATASLAEGEQDAALAAAQQLRDRAIRDGTALDAAARRRLGAALQRRGFSGDVVVRALRSLD